MKLRTCYNADGGNGGTPPPPPTVDLQALIPPEYKDEGSLKTIKDVPTLVKSYVNAQKLIGADKVILPQKDWDENKWNEYFSKLGRPQKPEDYKMPEIKLHDSLQIDNARLLEANKVFHKMGLSSDQAKGVMEYYLNTLNTRATEAETNAKMSSEKATQSLKELWGDKYEPNLGLAKLALSKMGSPELVGYLESSGLGNNVELIKMLHNVGIAMGEDNSKRGQGTGAIGVTPQDALRLIDQMKRDPDFSQVLAGKEIDARKKAELLAKWTELHKVAYPGVMQ